MKRIILLFISIANLLAQYVPNQYIVELKGEAAGKRAERRLAIREAQTRLSAGLAARGWRTLDRTENVANTLTIEGPGDRAEARALRRQFAEIGQVHRVRLFHKSLDRAAQVHNVAAAWERLGIANAGAGMKIGIIDSGIETSHPGFQNSDLPAIEGYPKVTNAQDLQYTNNKIIVARSYSLFWASRDPDTTVLDKSGHGTAVAMSAAGNPHDSPIGRLSGMAPAAYLGVYKIFGTPGINDSTTDAAILRAIDDAVSDGMDVINLSFGSILAPRPENDIIVRALARAEAAGTIAVISAGNEGPGLATMSSPGTAPTALTVGASENSRVFASSVSLSDGSPAAIAQPGARTAPTGSLSGPLVSVAGLDSDGLGCQELPAGSLSGKIALILRGVCFFEVKIRNATQAGATGAVVYTDQARPNDVFTMDVGTQTLPAVLVSYADGKRFLDLLANAPSVDVLLNFAREAVGVSPYRLTDFSSNGPVSGVPIKPDILAAGENIYTAAQSNYAQGDVYSATGYTVIAGTSFSSPITAGTVAVLKAARPGLRPVDYRSLLVNSARPLGEQPQLTIVQTGGGLLNLTGALDAPLRFDPVSVSFTQNDQSVEVANLSGTAATYNFSVEAKQGNAPVLSRSQVALGPNEVATLNLNLDLAALSPGVYSGAVIAQAEGGPILRVPYWYGKVSRTASEIQLLNQSSTARSGIVQQDLLFFRVLDTNGVSFTEKPSVRIVTGLGQLREVQDRDYDIAGSFGVELVLAPGMNTIEVDAGNGVVRRFSITGR